MNCERLIETGACKESYCKHCRDNKIPTMAQDEDAAPLTIKENKQMKEQNEQLSSFERYGRHIVFEHITSIEQAKRLLAPKLLEVYGDYVFIELRADDNKLIFHDKKYPNETDNQYYFAYLVGDNGEWELQYEGVEFPEAICSIGF